MNLLTVKETAELLRVSPVTVRRHIATGRLPAVRIGRAIRLERIEVERAIKPLSDETREDQDEIILGESTHADDPFWDIIGMANSADGEPTDVSVNHDKYLAEAYADLHE